VLALAWAATTFVLQHSPPDVPPRQHAFLVYGASVAAMLLLVRGATTVLDGVEAGRLRPAAITVGVGLRFLSFGWVLPAVSGLFRVLGLVLTSLGCAGMAGLGMLALVAQHSLRH
jgi:hypothetical protein